MERRSILVFAPCVLAALFGTRPPALAQNGKVEPTGARSSAAARPSGPGESRTAFPPAALPYEEMPAGVRERVRLTVEKATLAARGPVEVFACQPATYYYLVNHPDRAVAAWHRLGADCADITDRGNGRFGWTDGTGSDVSWETVHAGPQLRVWYAHGQVNPGLLLPTVPFQAVFVLRHAEGQDSAGRPLMRHQAELFLHSDSKTATVVARMLGPAAPRLAEQYLAQVEMFFSVLSAYLTQHPEMGPALLAPKGPLDMLEGVRPAAGKMPVKDPWAAEKR